MINLEKNYPTIWQYINNNYKLRLTKSYDIAGIQPENAQKDDYSLMLVNNDDATWYYGNTLDECLDKCEGDLIIRETLK